MDLTTLDDAALEQLAHDVDAERGRRRALADAHDLAAQIEADAALRLDEVAVMWHAAHDGTGTPDAPVEWVAPTAAHDAWPRGAVVTRDGRVFESLIPNNSTVPGDESDPQSGRWWRELTDESADDGAWAPWVDYAADQAATYDGDTYTCLQAHTSQPGWEPPNVPALWSKEN